jgi:hypothetical protein
MGFENLTTISVELGFLWDFVLLSLKTCSLYHEKLFIQVVNDISTQVFNNFFSASDIMDAVRGRFRVWHEGCVIQVILLRNKWVGIGIAYELIPLRGRGREGHIPPRFG